MIVGEGADEMAFLTHLKSLFITRGCGLSVKIKNAQGKGAKHVVEWTQQAIAAYDTVAVLVDTDTDWSDSVSRLATKKKIHLLLSEPCFEALMMRILKEDPNGDGIALKKRFAPFVKDDATQSENYLKYFGRNCLLESRAHVPTIDTLLSLLGL